LLADTLSDYYVTIAHNYTKAQKPHNAADARHVNFPQICGKG